MEKILIDLNNLEMQVKDTLGIWYNNKAELEHQAQLVKTTIDNIMCLDIAQECKEEVAKSIRSSFNNKIPMEDIRQTLKIISDRMINTMKGKNDIIQVDGIPHSKLQEINKICSEIESDLYECKDGELYDILEKLGKASLVLEEFNNEMDELYLNA